MTEMKEKQDCSTAGSGFARTDRTKIAPEDCGSPKRGFAQTDFGKKQVQLSRENTENLSAYNREVFKYKVCRNTLFVFTIIKIQMASQERFELPTHGLEGRCSILLSYRGSFAEVQNALFFATGKSKFQHNSGPMSRLKKRSSINE